jgi:FtsP/CotA-like multicopper oxidase with cupredoxin domain
MATHPATPTYRSREPDSTAFARMAAVLLGLLVGVLGIFALLLWADARDDQASAAPAAAEAVTHDHNTALPLDSFAGVVPANAQELAAAHKAYDAVMPPLVGGDLVKVHMTLKDMAVEIAPGVRYDTWAFDGHGAPGPVVHVRQGQTVEMTLTNGGKIPHSIDFHAARIAPNVAFKDVAPGDSFTFRFKANDPGVFMYHCGTKPVLAHIANGMYGAIVVEPRQASRTPTGSTCSSPASGTWTATASSSRRTSTWRRRGPWPPTGRRSTAMRTSTSTTR